ncbi:MAG: hypothetical protein APU95_01610 [Hadesarchaea archaeon YNP_N21]|nr:MAG: hypothetical protein APU95_01610 [Hadesarchaea archaeon YNP_N21]
MEIEYEPKSVRELMTEMKDTSDLMIDLAYASILFESDELAGRVLELESKMDELMYRIRVTAAAAARGVEQAKKITGILQVANAAEMISNATGDMVDLVLKRAKIHRVVREAIATADERLGKIGVLEGSELVGKSLDELKLPSSIGIWILAIKKGESWIVPPTRDDKIEVGDVLFVRGPPDGVEMLCKMARTTLEGCPFRAFKVIRTTLAEMRDLSGIMDDLAYSSVLLGSKEIADEVMELDKEFGELNHKLWIDTLKAARREKDLEALNSILQVAKCMERIADAAELIVDIVLRGVELHPVFAKAIAEADEGVAKVEVPQDSPLAGERLGDLNLWSTTGVYVLMIKRNARHIFDPSMNLRLQGGDVLIVRGPQLGIEKLRGMVGKTQNAEASA